MATIDQSQFNKSRLDKFLLVTDVPDVLKEITTNDLAGRKNNSLIGESLQFSVYGAVVPSIAVPENDLRYAGQSLKVSSHVRPSYDNVTVNFTIDNMFNNYWVIYKWLDFLNDEKFSKFNQKELANIPTVAPEDREKDTLTPTDLYTRDFTIFGKDEFDNNIIKFTYTKAFPVSLGNISYSYREPGEIETTFEFAFSQLLVELV